MRVVKNLIREIGIKLGLIPRIGKCEITYNGVPIGHDLDEVTVDYTIKRP